MYEELIREYYPEGEKALSMMRFRALVSCLTAKERSEFTLKMVKSSINLKQRDFITGLVIKDMKLELGAYHFFMLKKLVRIVQTNPYRYAQRAAKILETVCDSIVLNKKYTELILNSFLESSYLSHRNRAYKLYKIINYKTFGEVIAEAWFKLEDWNAFIFIIYNFPDHYLNKHFDEFREILKKDEYYSYVLRRLYSRVSSYPDKLELIKQEDEITHAWIYGKNKMKMSDEEALELWSKYSNSDRAGLLLWVFGQCGLWNVLSKIELD